LFETAFKFCHTEILESSIVFSTSVSFKTIEGCYGMNIPEQKPNPAFFIRIHRSAIININSVKEVFKESNGYFIKLQNGLTQKWAGIMWRHLRN
jgi:hypothetical protein